jgi:hypothetical protein
MKKFEDILQEIRDVANYVDTDNVQPYSEMITQHYKDKIKEQLNSLYGTNEERYNKNIFEALEEEIKHRERIKIELFKLEVIRLMQQYELSISHEDKQGEFIIRPYSKNFVEWFLDAEFKE